MTEASPTPRSSSAVPTPGGRTARRSIDLLVERCTSCMICARECPVWCIGIESHAETVGDPAARRPHTVNVLDRFDIDWGLCMVCGICIEACPFDALAWSASPPTTARGREGLARVWTTEGT